MDWADRIGRRIKLRDLHILLAVAECGSMAKASARLSVSHPVVSKTILELERTLGIRLFDRSSQGVEVTAHGTALLNCGVTVFNEMRHGLKLLKRCPIRRRESCVSAARKSPWPACCRRSWRNFRSSFRGYDCMWFWCRRHSINFRSC